MKFCNHKFYSSALVYAGTLMFLFPTWKYVPGVYLKVFQTFQGTIKLGERSTVFKTALRCSEIKTSLTQWKGHLLSCPGQHKQDFCKNKQHAVELCFDWRRFGGKWSICQWRTGRDNQEVGRGRELGSGAKMLKGQLGDLFGTGLGSKDSKHMQILLCSGIYTTDYALVQITVDDGTCSDTKIVCWLWRFYIFDQQCDCESSNFIIRAA